jgi:hypothetical protein
MPALKYTETRVQFPAPPLLTGPLYLLQNLGKRDVFQGFLHFPLAAFPSVFVRQNPPNTENTAGIIRSPTLIESSSVTLKTLGEWKHRHRFHFVIAHLLPDREYSPSMRPVQSRCHIRYFSHSHSIRW